MHCPKCFCKHATILSDTQAECRYCGTRYRTRPTDSGKAIVHYLITLCPYCDSKHIKCTGTKGDHRYHLCSDCGKTFQSTERPIKTGWF